jgi:hypothetical protein
VIGRNLLNPSVPSLHRLCGLDARVQNLIRKAGEVGIEKALTVFSVAVNFRGDCFTGLSEEART